MYRFRFGVGFPTAVVADSRGPLHLSRVGDTLSLVDQLVHPAGVDKVPPQLEGSLKGIRLQFRYRVTILDGKNLLLI